MTNPWREFLVFVLAYSLLNGCNYLDPDYQRKNARAELGRRIRRYAAPPPLCPHDESELATMIDPDVDISGDWILRQHMAGSSMTIWQADDSPNDCVVQMAVSRCHGVWHRKGTFSNGVLELEEPVAVWHRAPFRTLVAIVIDGDVRLAPMPDVPDILNALRSGNQSFLVRQMTFERDGGTR
jgi:hypothetical protein